jgi:hypothetical protein
MAARGPQCSCQRESNLHMIIIIPTDMDAGTTTYTSSAFNTTNYIHPEEDRNFNYWCRKWGVTPRELQQAILHTGTLYAPAVKEYLKRDSWLYHPLDAAAKLVKQTLDYIF